MTGAIPKKITSKVKQTNTNFYNSKIAKSRGRPSIGTYNGKQSNRAISKSCIPKSLPSNKKVLQAPTKERPVMQQEDIVFEKDPSALASILNNEGLTTELLQKNAINEGRPSMVVNNTLLQPDGRLSLCRRVPIQRTKPMETAHRRHTLAGPRRVLSNKQGPNLKSSCVPRNSFIKPRLGTDSRHSLYSVVQGRYSNVNSHLNGRPSLLAGKKLKSEQQTTRSDSKTLVMKTPPVEIDASPALRIKQPTQVTPQPQRSIKKSFQARYVKWADETNTNSKDKIAMNLFKESPPQVVTPKNCDKKSKTAPVSILRSNKSKKPSFLTTPKKNVKIKRDGDDESRIVEEVVKPVVINESPEKKKRDEVRRHEKVKVAPTAPPKQSTVVDVDQVLTLLNQHLTKVKRRSVQGELSNVMKQIKASLQDPGSSLEAIAENCEEDEKPQNAGEKVEATELKKPVASDHDPVSLPCYPLTPGTVKDIRDHGDEETNKELDDLTRETKRIEEEMLKLKEQKERLKAFQDRTKKSTIQPPPQLLSSANLPDFSKLSLRHPPDDARESDLTSSRSDSRASWEEVLKAEMTPSPASNRNDVTSFSADRTSAAREFESRSDHVASVAPPALEIMKQLKVSTRVPSSRLASAQLSASPRFVQNPPERLTSAARTDPMKPITRELVMSRDGEDQSLCRVGASISSSYKKGFGVQPHSVQNPPEKLTSATVLTYPVKPIKNELILSRDVNNQSSFMNTTSISSTHKNNNIHRHSNHSKLPFPAVIAKSVQPIKGELLSSRDSSDHSSSRGSALIGSSFKENIIRSNSASHRFVRISSEKQKSDPIVAKPLQPIKSEFLPSRDAGDQLLSSIPASNQSSLKDAAKPIKSDLLPSRDAGDQSYPSVPNFNQPSVKHTAIIGSSCKENHVSSGEKTPLFQGLPFRLTPLKSGKFKPLLDHHSPSVSSELADFQHLSARRASPLQPRNLIVPDPIFPQPPRTPAAFRALKMSRGGANSNAGVTIKQQFAQALLDEEVSLLTCRVVKPSEVLQAPFNNDPVAHSLAHGDDSHFVPIIKTPSATPRRHSRRSSFSESAFSKYLRL